MSIKVKALGLGLLALLATAGFAVVNASATPSGHFVHEGPEEAAKVVGIETAGTAHQLFFRNHDDPAGDPIECTHAKYNGDVATKTVQSVTVVPTYEKCRTGSAPAGTHNVTVHVNGCGFILSSHGVNKHGTVEIECPTGNTIRITHPNCEITIPAQKPSGDTLSEGLTYTTLFENGKHTLTADVTVTTITGYYHNGLCAFLGTNQHFNMTGSLTVEGQDKDGNRINITHT